MAKKSFRYQHIYSVVDGKAPSATTLLEGEIAVNAFADNEKLFIKNSSGDVVDFPRSYSIKDIDEDMEIIAAALNELNDRKADWVSAVTSGAVDDDSNLEFYNRSGQTLFEIEIPGGNGDELTIHSGKDAQDKPIVSTLIYLKDVSSGETLPANVQKRYRLVDANGDNIVTASGDTSDAIDIYKDSSVVGAYIGTSGDSIESDTGVVTKLEVGDDWSGATSGDKVTKADFHFLNYIYFDGGFSGATISGDGEYKLVNVDLGQATAGVYGSGVTMTEDGAVTGVVDSASSVVVTEYTDSGDSATTEEVLTVGEDGFKVEHIQEAIDAKADIWRRLYHVTSGVARTDLVESATTLEYYNLSGDTLFQIELPIDNELDSGSTNPVQNSAITKYIHDDELVIASALADLNDRKLDASAYTDADVSKFVTSGKTVEAIPGDPSHSATTIDFYNLSGDTLFQIEMPEGADVDMDFDSGSTKALANSAITVTLEEMQKVTSAALNDLNTRKLDISAHTLFDEQLFVANGEFVESSTTAVFKNLSGDTLFEIPAGGGKCDTDPELDSGSTNPVANSAITLALEDKMDKQDFMTQLYPQGSVYITYEYKNPGEFLGGEWELIGGEDADKNYYPAFAISTDTAGTTIDESLPNIKSGEFGNDTGGQGRGEVMSRGGAVNAAAYTGSSVQYPAPQGTSTGPRTFTFDASKGQTNADGTTYVPSTASTYQNGAQVNVNSIKLFFWKRTDDAPVAMMLETITLEKVKDVLWEGSATGGTITLTGGSMADYDAIEFTVNNNSGVSGLKDVFTFERDKVEDGLILPLSWDASVNRFLYLTGVTETSFTIISNLVALTMVRGVKYGYVSRTDITTEINSGSTDDKAASAKAVYDAFAGIEFINRAAQISWNKGADQFTVDITCNADEVPLGKGATNVQTEGNIGFGYVSGNITKLSDTKYRFTGWANGYNCNYLVINATFVKLPRLYLNN